MCLIRIRCSVVGFTHITCWIIYFLNREIFLIGIGFEVRVTVEKTRTALPGLHKTGPNVQYTDNGWLRGGKRTRNQTAQKSGPTDFGFLDLGELCKQKYWSEELIKSGAVLHTFLLPNQNLWPHIFLPTSTCCAINAILDDIWSQWNGVTDHIE